MTKFSNASLSYDHNKPVYTENGMPAKASTKSDLLELFRKIGNSRNVSLVKEFLDALNENEELTLRMLLWARDIRGGAGERSTVLNLIKVLDNSRPKSARRLIHKLVEVGRFDDLFAFTKNREEALEVFAKALREGNQLAFKWAPREKSAKKEFAKALRKHLRMKPDQYRKFLASKAAVVEEKMCAGKWSEIDYSKLPSLASARYQAAFSRNDAERYQKYVSDLQEGKNGAKINAGALFPHDVVMSVINGNSSVANEQWKALPNYVGDAKILPIVDTSGSMSWYPISNGSKFRPIHVALSLGIYLSEKNTGDFRDLWMTFSTNPKFKRMKGSLYERYMHMWNDSDVGGSTNFEAAIKLVLDTAVQGNVAPEDMPEYLLVMSDMQFNMCVRDVSKNALSMIQSMYQEAGYEVPKIVFWNLSAHGDSTTPVTIDDSGTAIVSGYSPAILKAILSKNLENFTPYNVMMEAIMNERYDL